MKIAVTTLYTPEIEEFSKEAVKNFKAYCDLHNYDLFIYDKSIKQDLRGNWCKPKVLLNHIENYDHIVWLDSDIAILDFNRKLEDIIRPHQDKTFITTDDMGGWDINNGFMIFKNDKKSKHILELLWRQQSNFTNRARGDQKFFIDFINRIKLPKSKYHIYPQSEICAPLFLKNENSFSVHVMGIHINNIRTEYIKHINKSIIKKNKNVIYIVNAYDDYKMPDIWNYVSSTVISYANKCGADLIILKPENLNKYLNRAYFKVDVIDDFSKSDYEKMMILDNDIAIANISPNIFNEFSNEVMALDISKTHEGMRKYFVEEFARKIYPNLSVPDFMVSSGVVVMDKNSANEILLTKKNLRSPEEISKIQTFKRDETFCWEQNYFTYLINESNVKFKRLNYKFNFLASYLHSMSIEEWDPKNHIYFLHIFGKHKNIGLRCMSEHKKYFNGVKNLPDITLPRDSDIENKLKLKQDEFIKLKNQWSNFLDLDSLKYISKQISNPKAPLESKSCYNPNQKIAIISLYTKEISDYAFYSEQSIKKYCLKQNYTFHIYREKLDKQASPNWSKAQALLNHIDKHEYIVWMDSDTLIFNPEKKIEDIINKCTKNKHIIACEDIGANNTKLSKGSMLNSGVLIFKCHKYVKNLITEWRDFNGDKSSLYSSGGDQEILCDLLKKKDPFGFNRKIFPMNTFNTDPRLVDKDTFILHFMAYPYEFKKIFMSYWNQ